MAYHVHLLTKKEKTDHGTIIRKKEAPIGFSWTTSLFFAFVPLIRGDWVYFPIMFIIWCLPIDLFFDDLMVFFFYIICNITFGFVYNKIYLNNLIKKGYKITSETKKKKKLKKQQLVFPKK